MERVEEGEEGRGGQVAGVPESMTSILQFQTVRSY